MDRISYILLIFVIIILLVGIFASNQHDIQNKEYIIQFNTLNTPEPQILGDTSKGMVIKSGPYGNLNSTQKIAFIVGVHPMEMNSHRAIAASLLFLSKSLNSSYYIYSIDVTKDRGSYNNGRMIGQQLANKYAVPDIEKNNFNLAIDVHSNKGDYQEKRFICVPIDNNRSESIAFNIKDNIAWLVYYLPPKEKGPTSPDYVTVPLIKSGTPAVVYETYMYEPYEVTLNRASEFILTVDNMKL